MLNMTWLARELYREVDRILEALAAGTYYNEPIYNERNFPEPQSFDSVGCGGGD